MFKETYKYKTYRGGVYAPFIISMTSHTYHGRIGIATPDGRLAGKPFAANPNFLSWIILLIALIIIIEVSYSVISIIKKFIKRKKV